MLTEEEAKKRVTDKCPYGEPFLWYCEHLEWLRQKRAQAGSRAPPQNDDDDSGSHQTEAVDDRTQEERDEAKKAWLEKQRRKRARNRLVFQGASMKVMGKGLRWKPSTRST